MIKSFSDRKSKNSNFQKGFTLIELLIFMAMFSVLLVVFSQIFGIILEARLESESNANINQDGNYILNRFAYDLSRSTAITIPATDGTSSSSLSLNIGGTTYQYQINSGNLVQTVSSTTNNLNSFNTTISNLNFQRIGNDNNIDTIRFSYTVTSRIQESGGYESEDFSSTVGLRDN